MMTDGDLKFAGTILVAIQLIFYVGLLSYIDDVRDDILEAIKKKGLET